MKITPMEVLEVTLCVPLLDQLIVCLARLTCIKIYSLKYQG